MAERLSRFKSLLDTGSTVCRPTSGIGKAITYARRQWDSFVVFLDDGNAPRHNNTSERLLRWPVVGRTYWMVAGSEGGAGAEAAAVFFSVVASCELVGIDPFDYLRDILSLLPDATPARLRDLTPMAWAERSAEKPA